MNYKDVPEIKPSETWVNYGDINPKIHGGRWVRYDPDLELWEIIQTYVWADIDPDGSENIIIQRDTVYWDDIFKDGEPEKGPTSALSSVLEQFNVDYLTAMVDNPIEYWIADIPGYAHFDYETVTVTPEEYWPYLDDAFGITPDMS